MIINNIKYNDKLSLFDITINDKIFSISYELYEMLNITYNQELDIKTYNIIEEESIYQGLKKIAENFINYKQRTEQEVKNKLYKFDKNQIAIEKVINYYKKLDLINDKRYAKDYIYYALFVKNYSLLFTKNKLMQKGVNSTIIDEYLNEYDKDIEKENLYLLFDKKYSKKDLDNIKQLNKIYRYLSSKGFNYELIKEIINEKRRK